MLFFKTLSLVAVAAVASVTVSAIPTLKITNLSDNASVTFTDASGFISASTNVLAGWSIVASTGFTTPAIGGPADPQFSLTGSAIRTSTSAGSLKFEFFEDLFTASPFQALLSGSVTGTSSGAFGTMVYSSQLENTPYVSTAPLVYNNSSNASANVLGASVTPSLTPYVAGLVTTLNVSDGVARRSVAFTTALSAVPEPGFYGALAIGLSGLFAAAARRRAAAKV